MKDSIFQYRLLRYLGMVLLCISFLAINDAQAQRRSKSYLKKKNKKIGSYKGGSIHFDESKRYASVGFSVDALNYFGDITPKSGMLSTDISLTRPAFSVYGTYRYTPNLSFRGSLSWGRLTGDDFQSADPYGTDSRFRYVRNASFRNDIKELAIVGIWDIFPNHGTFLNRVSFTPYVFAGVAVFHHNPKGKAPENDKQGQPLAEAGKWVALRELGTEGQYSEHYDVKPYSLIQPSIPFGLGIRTKLQKRLDFEFEIGYRYLFTDYIDDVSGMYVDLGALDSELARAMSDRSRETVSARSGEARDFDAIGEVVRTTTYTSLYNGESYTVFGGYGQEHPDNIRGMSSDKDIYIVTSFKISYIISGSFRRAKFR
ncbi:MAG: hypothetical protein HC819_01390 [Cyclobacteriaceae bacterium]|nr:hypothetical protein [Cyclobacteriaceae bacterium]